MEWIIIILLIIIFFVIPLVIQLVKHILFNPLVNSALSIVSIVYVLFASDIWIGIKIIYIFSLLDCIRDIKIANFFYDNVSYHIDSLYLKKSLLSLVTSGLARAGFFLFQCPYAYLCVLKDTNQKMKSGYPLKWDAPYDRSYSDVGRIIDYHYNHYIDKLLSQGKLVSNVATISREVDLSRQKRTEKIMSSPKKAKGPFHKIKAFFKKDSYHVDDCAPCGNVPTFKHAYLGAKFFKRYPKRIEEVMRTKGTVSPWKIKLFDELSDLNLTMTLEGDDTWSEPFIIMALDELISEGMVEDLALSDAVEINHTYRHVGGAVMKQTDLNALLDDDDF